MSERYFQAVRDGARKVHAALDAKPVLHVTEESLEKATEVVDDLMWKHGSDEDLVRAILVAAFPDHTILWPGEK